MDVALGFLAKKVRVFDRSSNHFIIFLVSFKMQKQAMSCPFVVMTKCHQMNVMLLHQQIQAQYHSPIIKMIVSVICLNHYNYHHILLTPIRHQKNMAGFINPTVIIHFMKKNH